MATTTELSTFLVKTLSKGGATSHRIVTCEPDKLMDLIHQDYNIVTQHQRLGVGTPTFFCNRRVSLFTAEQADAYQCGYVGSPKPSKDWVLHTLGQMGEAAGICDEDRREQARQEAADIRAEYRSQRGDY